MRVRQTCAGADGEGAENGMVSSFLGMAQGFYEKLEKIDEKEEAVLVWA